MVDDVRQKYAEDLKMRMTAYKHLKSRLLQEKQVRWMESMRGAVLGAWLVCAAARMCAAVQWRV